MRGTISVARGSSIRIAQRAGPHRGSIAARALCSHSREHRRGKHQRLGLKAHLWCRWSPQGKPSGAGCRDRCAVCSVSRLLIVSRQQLEIFGSITEGSKQEEEHPIVPIKTVVAV